MCKKLLYLLALASIFLCGCTEKTEVSYVLSSVSGSDLTESRETSDSGSAGDTTESVCVYVCGAVNAPGVYELPAGSRIYEALEAAGGLQEGADEKSLNQAELLQDGQQITVYTLEETEAGRGGPASEEPAGENEKVNLNTAGKELLMSLPGIGEAKAEAILNYREKNGKFSEIEELKNIEGIKEKVFEKIRDLIKV